MGVNYTPSQEEYKEYKSFDVFFKSFVLQNFPLIEEDFDSLTYYQMLSKIVGYMKDVIDNNKAIQDNQEAVLEAYNELQNYVNNYFDNLDVQTEINNKLDEMVQNGELQTLLNSLFADLREETETRLDEQNTRLNNMQNQVNAVAGGTPKVVTSTASMTDTNKIYVLSTNGKWYYYNGSAWTIGGDYQPASTDLDSIRNEIPLSTNIPNMYIKEIYLENYDATRQIELRSIRKAWYDSAGDQKYHTDFTLKYSDDATNATLTGFGFTRNTEESALEVCEQKIYPLASSTSEVTGYVIIDYSQLETGTRILNPSTHVVLNPNKYKFLPNNPSIENYITNQQISDYLPYIRQKFTNIYSVGHQGFGAGQNGYRGNSLTGFKKGAIFGFDCLECDLQVTSDNKLVLNHDPTITDDNNVTYTIAETTYDELRSHLYGGETICSFEECLNVCKTFGVDLSIDKVIILYNKPEAYNLMKSLIYLYSMQERVYFATFQMWRGGETAAFQQQVAQDFPQSGLVFKNEDATWTTAKFDIVQEDYIEQYGIKKVLVGGPYNTTYSVANIRVAQQYPDMKVGFYTIDVASTYYNVAKRVDWITSDRYCGRNVVLISGFLN